MNITKDSTIGEIIMENRAYIPVLMNFGMPCVGCPASQFETLEEAATVHDVDVNLMIDALKEVSLS